MRCGGTSVGSGEIAVEKEVSLCQFGAGWGQERVFRLRLLLLQCWGIVLMLIHQADLRVTRSSVSFLLFTCVLFSRLFVALCFLFIFSCFAFSLDRGFWAYAWVDEVGRGMPTSFRGCKLSARFLHFSSFYASVALQTTPFCWLFLSSFSFGHELCLFCWYFFSLVCKLSFSSSYYFLCCFLAHYSSFVRIFCLSLPLLIR